MSYFEKLNRASFKAESIIMGVNDEYVIDCHKNWSNLEGVNNLTNMSCLLWRIEDQKIVEVFNFPENQNRVDEFFIDLYDNK